MKMCQQTSSNPGPQDHKSDALTTRPPTEAAEPMENLCYLCTQLINVYVMSIIYMSIIYIYIIDIIYIYK